MAAGFKLTVLMIIVITLDDVANLSVVVESESLSTGDPPKSAEVNDDQLTSSDPAQTAELRDRIAKLQSDVSDIVKSFTTLDIVAGHPSVMRNIEPETHESDRHAGRSRRDVLGQCVMCQGGTPGPRGPPGSTGIPGRDGRDGRDGSIILEESRSHNGRRCDDQQRAPIPNPPRGTNIYPAHGGAVYTRWGHSDCPGGAELIYTGIIAGSYFTHPGNGANYLCLPPEPIYDEVDRRNDARAILHSTEYETSTAPGRIRSVHDETPQCAVCRAPANRTSTLMIPARNVCPSDAWRLEYAGYLMSDRWTHKRTEYICVDRSFETEPRTRGDQDGSLLYMVEARCLTGGGLQCGPYIDGYELTCAVCTI